MTGLRQAIAARSPAVARKAIRMGEHYVRRNREWLQVLRELKGSDPGSQRILLRSSLVAPLTSLRRLDGFEPPLLLADAQLEARGVGRFNIRAGTDDIIHILTAREPLVRRAIEQRLKPGDVFVDAGANIGFYSVLAARLVGAAGKVVAIEMMPETAAALRSHLAINGCDNVEVIEQALSDRSGDHVTARFNPRKFGQASIAAVGDEPQDQAGDLATIEVMTVTLDEVLAHHSSIKLIKMDLEGAEYAALVGLGERIDNVEAVIFETNGEDPRIMDYFAQHGFAVARLYGHDFLAQRAPHRP